MKIGRALDHLVETVVAGLLLVLRMANVDAQGTVVIFGNDIGNAVN